MTELELENWEKYQAIVLKDQGDWTEEETQLVEQFNNEHHPFQPPMPYQTGNGGFRIAPSSMGSWKPGY